MMRLTMAVMLMLAIVRVSVAQQWQARLNQSSGHHHTYSRIVGPNSCG